MTLTEFLLARIDEDEAAALALIGKPETNDTRSRLAVCSGRDYYGGTGYLDVTPARVLAECKAKREVVDLYDPNDYADDGGIGSSWVMKQALEALAVVYSDHPDYREKW